MKKLFICLLVVSMLFTAVPVSAESTYDEMTDVIVDEQTGEVMPCRVGVIVQCSRCGNGYAELLCLGSYPGNTSTACTWTSHEDYDCQVSTLFGTHNGQCRLCGGMYYSSAQVHTHGQRHSCSSEDLVSCIYL